jgi:hypothetical protein
MIRLFQTGAVSIVYDRSNLIPMSLQINYKTSTKWVQNVKMFQKGTCINYLHPIQNQYIAYGDVFMYIMEVYSDKRSLSEAACRLLIMIRSSISYMNVPL